MVNSLMNSSAEKLERLKFLSTFDISKLTVEELKIIICDISKIKEIGMPLDMFKKINSNSNVS